MRKLIAGIAALALASVVLFAGSTTPAQAGLQPVGAFLSGYAPVWQGSNSSWSSAVVADIQMDHAPCPQWNSPAVQCTYSYIRGWDDNVFSNADTVCAKNVYYHTADQQLHNGTEKCTQVPEGKAKKVESWGGFYIDGVTGAIPFGSCYKTWPDGNPYNGREWCNTIFG